MGQVAPIEHVSLVDTVAIPVRHIGLGAKVLGERAGLPADQGGRWRSYTYRQ